MIILNGNKYKINRILVEDIKMSWAHSQSSSIVNQLINVCSVHFAKGWLGRAVVRSATPGRAVVRRAGIGRAVVRSVGIGRAVISSAAPGRAVVRRGQGRGEDKDKGNGEARTSIRMRARAR